MSKSIVMIGATGAVGGEVLRALLRSEDVGLVTVIGRRKVEGVDDPRVVQITADLEASDAYRTHLQNHDMAIWTVGVGEPTKVSQDVFKRIDHDLVLTFAQACRGAGVNEFSLLASVGADSTSRSFYLRTKGALEDALRSLGFEKLSLFHPSMILTPTNRYGLSQGITLAVWPVLSILLVGPLRKFRGIKVQTLGSAIAADAIADRQGEAVLEYDDFVKLASALS